MLDFFGCFAERIRRIIEQPRAVSTNRLLGDQISSTTTTLQRLYLLTNAWLLLYRYQIMATETSEFLCYRFRTTPKRWASEVISSNAPDEIALMGQPLNLASFITMEKSFPQNRQIK